MCDALPGPRSASDTREHAHKTHLAYHAAHSGGPAVNTLAAATSQNATVAPARYTPNQRLVRHDVTFTGNVTGVGSLRLSTDAFGNPHATPLTDGINHGWVLDGKT